MNEKFPLKIIKDKINNKYKAATSFDKINDGTKNIKEELRYIESDYAILISNICQLFYRISMEPKKKTDPRLYWLIGDNLIRFIERIGDLGFYLLKQNKTFAADIGISESSVSRIILFRKRFLKISAIDANISWSKYRDNKI
jgi:hypothetical protein